MKWYLLFFLRGMSVGGPFDTEQACRESLKASLEQTVMDQGFDNAKPFGLCFQAVGPRD